MSNNMTTPSQAPSKTPLPSAPTTTSSSSSSSKPLVTLGPTTHLDPGTYVRGSQPITIGAKTLVHPRVQLVALHGPLDIGETCIICEKAVVGGPLPPSSSAETPTPRPKPTTIGSSVYIHPHAQIHHSTSIASYAIVESHATLLPGASLGAHSKLCAGVTIDYAVPDWTVVYGDGRERRKRRPQSKVGEGESAEDEIETMRLKTMTKEREATILILRTVAKALTAARKK